MVSAIDSLSSESKNDILHLRGALKHIYDNREAILDEPLSPNAYRNKGLRLRQKLSRQRKLFEDRLAAVILDFSSKIDLDTGLVQLIAKAWVKY